MQILQILLYGRNGKRRVVALRPNRVNIISGDSKTGKSALLDIIDFCLGRRSCNVAAGVIRDHVTWFALLLDLDGSQAFIARPNPDAATGWTNSDCVWQQGVEVRPPATASELRPNVSLEGLVDQLDAALGIVPNEHIPEGDAARPPLRASVKHAKFFCFQDQHEVNARGLLFHRQNDNNGQVALAIRDTLPYFLGAVADTTLGHRQMLKDARRDLRRLAGDEAERAAVAGEVGVRARTLLAEATEVSLVDADADGSPLDLLAAVSRRGLPPPDRTRTGADADETRRLRDVLAEQQREHVELREQIALAERFNAAEGSFEGEAARQLARLRVVDILPKGEPEGACPLCSRPIEQSVPAADDLRASALELARQLDAIETRRPRVDEHVAELRSRLSDVSAAMRDARQQLSAIEDAWQAAGSAADMRDRQAIVLGRISLYLASVSTAPGNQASEARLAELRSLVERLQDELSLDRVREVTASVLNSIGVTMTRHAEALKLEYAGHPYRLDIGPLTVVVDAEDGPIRMGEMGSAENYLGCHLIAHLALHSWFARRGRPVPRFLFLDQPSSTYYPSDRGEAGDPDRAAVSRLYAWLIDTVEQRQGGFQVLVVDHAMPDEATFDEHVIEEWRRGVALIPMDWLNASAG